MLEEITHLSGAPLFLKLQTPLECLSRAAVWRIVIVGTIAITVSAYVINPLGLILQPLYLLPICLASWRLGFPVGLGMAVASAALPASAVDFPKDVAVATQLANLGALMFTQSVVAGIVSSLRHSCSRERYRARRDIMTGALNRQAFEQDLQLMIASSAVDDHELLLLYLDLDGFKAVNDQYGHHVGDELLQAFSAGILHSLRRTDSLGRVGGDEFALAIPLGLDEEAQQVAQHLHSRFSALLSASGHSVTCSMGALVVQPGASLSCAELMRSADRLMYASKRGGKNAMTIATAISHRTGPARDSVSIHDVNLPNWC